MLVPLVGSVYPIPPAPYSYLPYIVLVYVAIGCLIVRQLGKDPKRLERVGKILSDAEQ